MPRGRTSVWNTAFLAFLVLYLLALVLLPMAISTVIRISDSYSSAVSRFVFAAESIHNWLMAVFAAAWVFFLGAVFASFLNVVATRVPRGESILGSSRCPRCLTKLTFRDNIPIWGWLKNRGRCRTCRLPIERRYVLVEAALGAIFLFLVFLELSTGGATLPVRPADRITDFLHMLFEPTASLLVIVIYHLLLILCIFLFALIEFENDRLPPAVFWAAALMVLAFPLLFPDAWLMNWDFPVVNRILPLNRNQLVTGMLLGGFVGWLAGQALEPWGRARDDTVSHRTLGLGCVVIGIALGWQSILVIAMIFGLILVVHRRILLDKKDNRRWRESVVRLPNAILLLLLLIHLCCWRWFNLLA